MNVVEEGDFSDLVFDQESKILLFSYPNDQTCGLRILDYGKYINQGLKENDFGIKAIKASSDMNHVFTGGNDRCLFFFSLGVVAKNIEKNINDIQDADNFFSFSIFFPFKYSPSNIKIFVFNIYSFPFPFLSPILFFPLILL